MASEKKDGVAISVTFHPTAQWFNGQHLGRALKKKEDPDALISLDGCSQVASQATALICLCLHAMLEAGRQRLLWCAGNQWHASDAHSTHHNLSSLKGNRSNYFNQLCVRGKKTQPLKLKFYSQTQLKSDLTFTLQKSFPTHCLLPYFYGNRDCSRDSQFAAAPDSLTHEKQSLITAL